MYLYRVTVEVKHMEGTELPPDCDGGFAGVYLPANNIKAAITQAEETLINDKFMPVRTHEATEINLEVDAGYRSMHDASPLSEDEPAFDELVVLVNQGGYLYTTFRLFTHEAHKIQ